MLSLGGGHTGASRMFYVKKTRTEKQQSTTALCQGGVGAAQVSGEPASEAPFLSRSLLGPSRALAVTLAHTAA